MPNERLVWSVVVPVKLLRLAKTRLVGVPRPGREGLALAMALDTVGAALACPAVAQVVAVSDDAVAVPLLAALGARVVGDEPDAGLNPALAYGAHVAVTVRPGDAVAALSSDLPALRPDELATALNAAGSYERAVVADAAGSGTTLLTARPGVALQPAYGAGSLTRHVAAGAVLLDIPVGSGLRRDVDTEDDLADVQRLGVGPHTRAALARLRG